MNRESLGRLVNFYECCRATSDPEMPDLDSYRAVGPFRFKEDEYSEAIEKAKTA
jgi:hypothetical protein